jgi:hypothetical protein
MCDLALNHYQKHNMGQIHPMYARERKMGDQHLRASPATEMPREVDIELEGLRFLGEDRGWCDLADRLPGSDLRSAAGLMKVWKGCFKARL